MQSAVAAIEALFILFLMIGLGWVLRARRVVALVAMSALSVISLDVALTRYGEAVENIDFDLMVAYLRSCFKTCNGRL